MGRLLNRNDMNLELDDWQKHAFLMFHSKIADKERKFPCIPAIQGYVLDQLRYGFVADPRTEDAIKETAYFLKEYGQCSKDIGEYSALILFYKTPYDLQILTTVKLFEQIFWNLLNKVSTLDTKEWPKSVSPDPSHFSWEFCFEGERYFIYCATPAHEHRYSRYFPYFMLAITPRWVLNHFFTTNQASGKITEVIRERLVKYDKMQPHPDLKWYGQEDNHEWKQYFLRDDNTGMSSCPFHYRPGKGRNEQY
ncbi:MAG TPA: YqcI/YcgG family protein [Bacillus sp. (in: firmicutes)]|uniref:YqcI/YcgG family protein n=1 Tax=Bacillus litorisediminis TaxID=2922713 RepID=UPI001FACD911|nr:YqcI/YcgG family protein [Bacillus litorisediminis]HWO76736.1 YqcI/YcgG family protein [Bacillus sp. (in: firmicutes)]